MFSLLTLAVILLLETLAYGQQTGPNIVYIISDDQARTDYGFILDIISADWQVFKTCQVLPSYNRLITE